MGTVKSGRKKIRIRHIILIVLGMAVLGSLFAFLADAPVRQELKVLTIGNVDFTNLRDGVFVGKYTGTKGHSRDAAVQVTVSGGDITEIRILKGALDGNGNPAKMAGGITMADLFEKAVAAQSLQVDTVSGATLTSKAHLKALENALIQAQKE